MPEQAVSTDAIARTTRRSTAHQLHRLPFEHPSQSGFDALAEGGWRRRASSGNTTGEWLGEIVPEVGRGGREAGDYELNNFLSADYGFLNLKSAHQLRPRYGDQCHG